MSQAGPAKSCCECLCHNAADNPSQVLVSLLQSSNQVTTAITEVARLQAHAVLAVVQRENSDPTPTISSSVPVQGNDKAIPAAEVIPTAKATLAGMVISERVGSISVVDWERMSTDNMSDLDRALRRIVKKTMVPGVDWGETGATIQRELAVAGFGFKTAGELTTLDEGRDWVIAENVGLSDLVRMRAAVSAARSDLGSDWWADEMVRIVVRLMELRGLQ